MCRKKQHVVVVCTLLVFSAAASTYAQKIYWTDRDADRIQRANVDGSNVEDLIASKVAAPHAIALDVAAEQMYWADAGTRKLQRAGLDGANIEDLLTHGLVTPSGLALDLNARKMYWTDTVNATIQRANMEIPVGETAENRTDVETLLVATYRIQEGIAIDPIGGKVYWASYFPAHHALNRANLDGSDIEELVTAGFSSVHGIALDVAAGKIYWTAGSFSSAKLLRANMDIPANETPDNRSDVETILTTELSVPRGLAIDPTAGRMYWTDRALDKIQSADLNGANIEDVVAEGLAAPEGVALDPVAGRVYWTDLGNDKIQRANLDGSQVEDVIAARLVMPVGIALDLAAGYMYWADDGTNRIQRASLDIPDGETPLDRNDIEDVVIQNAAYSYIALDLPANKMYWTDATSSNFHIWRADLDGSAIETLDIPDLRWSFGIAVDPVEGKIYWSDADVGIRRANRDGSAPEDFLLTDFRCETDVVLDLITRRIYWGDYCADNVQRAKLSDAISEQLVAGVDTANGLALDLVAGKIYWTNTGYPTLALIQRANLDGSDVEDVITTGLNSPWGIAIDRTLPADCDRNGIVNMADFASLAACLTGPGTSIRGCTCVDPDRDGDFDLRDIAILQAGFMDPSS
ncbi:MAG: PQQ-binding-like beta-propeller repeat protein [Planctomycetes bacterium]|nr:PQQ-binding-like beta-propeller repeat protein [Planctomycetota bacterium]